MTTQQVLGGATLNFNFGDVEIAADELQADKRDVGRVGLRHQALAERLS